MASFDRIFGSPRIPAAGDLTHDRLDSALMRAVLAGTPGVEMIEADAEHERLWIFGNGTVETEGLLGTLAWWGTVPVCLTMNLIWLSDLTL